MNWKKMLALYTEVSLCLMHTSWFGKSSVIGTQSPPFLDALKKVKVKSLSHVRLFATPWTVAYQAPQSMEFSRQEYWSGLPFPSPGDLPNPGIKPRPGIEPGSPALQADAYHLSHQGSHPCIIICYYFHTTKRNWLMRQRPYDAQI